MSEDQQQHQNQHQQAPVIVRPWESDERADGRQQNQQQQQQQNQHQQVPVIIRPWESDERADGRRLVQMNCRMGMIGTHNTPSAFTSVIPSFATWSSELFGLPHPVSPLWPWQFYPLFVSIPEVTSSLSLNIAGHHNYSSTVGNSNSSNSSLSAASSFHESATMQDNVPLGRIDSKVRRRSLFSAEVIAILRDWYKVNLRNPYPTDQDLCRLSRECCLTKRQIQKWISNRRDRTSNTRPRSMRQRMMKALSAATPDDHYE